MTEPVGLFAPGIYFGLDADTYHADPALGGTDVSLLVRDPVEFQYRRLKPEPEETAALIRGRAQHARCLEGMAAFTRQFKVKPEKEMFPDPVLDTIDELKEYAYGIGLDKLPRLKDDLIDAIRNHDRSVIIWAEIMRAHEADPRTSISADIAAQVEQASEWMQEDPLTGAVMENGTFEGGAAEVSIFWNEDDLRLKCRFDYLYPGRIVDLKTFSSWRDQSIAQGAINAIVSYRYDLAAAHYLRGWRAAQTLWLDYGPAAAMSLGSYGPPLDLCKQVFDLRKHNGSIEIHEPAWVWVFLKSIGAPQPIVLEWTRDRSPFSYGAAEDEVEAALARYRTLRKEFGDNKPWPPRHGAVLLDDGMWPPWFGRPR